MNKRRHLRIILTLLICATCSLSWAQKSVQDSAISISSINANYAYQSLSGKVSERFSDFHTFGASFARKLRQNWLFGLDVNFMYSPTVRGENPIAGISTEIGAPINQKGLLEDIIYAGRGYNAYVRLGKVFPIFGPNPNSGIYLGVGAGFMEYWIHYSYTGQELPQLQGDYLKGYDRLTNGLLIQQELGYMHFSNKNWLNFFLGVEIMQGQTQNRRSFDFAQRRALNDPQSDQFYAFKFRWMIAFYPKDSNKEEFFF